MDIFDANARQLLATAHKKSNANAARAALVAETIANISSHVIGCVQRGERWIRVYDLRVVDVDVPLIPLLSDEIGALLAHARSVDNLTGNARAVAQELHNCKLFRMSIEIWPKYTREIEGVTYVRMPTRGQEGDIEPIGSLWCSIIID